MTEYIEREAALKELEEKLLRGQPPANEYMKSIVGIVRCVVKMIPAADVEPVVREECDHCSSKEQRADNGEPYSMEWYLVQNGCKFCPECGRRLHMDERSKHED